MNGDGCAISQGEVRILDSGSIDVIAWPGYAGQWTAAIIVNQ